jgi:hypothetical protein
VENFFENLVARHIYIGLLEKDGLMHCNVLLSDRRRLKVTADSSCWLTQKNLTNAGTLSLKLSNELNDQNLDMLFWTERAGGISTTFTELHPYNRVFCPEPYGL